MKLSALAAALALAASPALAQSARVVDGDTLKVDGVTYRLWGIDAPEVRPTLRRWMACGTSSHRTLACTDWRTPCHLRTSDARSLRPHCRSLPCRWARPRGRYGGRWSCLGPRQFKCLPCGMTNQLFAYSAGRSIAEVPAQDLGRSFLAAVRHAAPASCSIANNPCPLTQSIVVGSHAGRP